MRCHKTGVSVAPAMIEHQQRYGDEFICPECEMKIVTGFGKPTVDHDRQADLLLMG
jgi:hypothetical protein